MYKGNVNKENVNELFNRRRNRIISLILCGGLILSGGLLYGYYRGDTVSASTKIDKDIKSSEKKISKHYPSLLKSNGESLDKTETTYAIMDRDGDLKNVIVSEQLSNKNNSKEIKDISNLKNIENTSGKEKFKQKGEELLWEADGKKIAYKGNGTSQLPVNVKISYYLNGEKKTAKEIAGKSGNIKIRFEYEITGKDNVNGKTYLHPYTMASGLILDNTHFSDVKVTNGKTIDDGSKTIAFGVALPGMNENLGIDKSKLDIPSTVEISGFTDKFNIMGTYSIAMSGIVNDLDTGKADELKDKAETLKSGLVKLSSSSKELLKGGETLEQGALELNKGTLDLSQGAEKLKNGSGELESGMKTLNAGLKSLSKNSGEINSGIAQLERSIFENATDQLRQATGSDSITLTPQTYIQVINGISGGAVEEAEGKLRASLNAYGIKDTNIQSQILSVAYNLLMTQGKTEANRKDIESAVLEAGEIAKKASFVGNAIEKNSEKVVPLLELKGYSGDQITPEIIAVASTAFELAGGNPLKIEEKLPQATELCKTATIFKNGEMNARENVSKLSAMAVGKDTPKKLADLKSKLDQVESLVAGIHQYTAGVDSAAAGSEKLLYGVENLKGGIGQLKDGSDKLADGSSKLLEGIMKLNSGMKKFDKEGIDKFTSMLSNAELAKIMENFEGIKEASKKEIFVGGKSDEMSGESKILFKTGEVK